MSDDERLAARIAHPILADRLIAVSHQGVLHLLERRSASFAKEDGERIAPS